MEASVKERLTGALIFVAAMVVIVPEMFSGPEPGSTVAAPAQPAESGPPLRTFSMTLNDSAESRAAVPEVQAQQSSPAEEAPVARPAAPVPAEAAPVAAATSKPAAPEPVTAAGDSDWWLQVGIFGVRDNADRLARKLQAEGFSVAMDKQVLRGKDMYRVRAGPVRDRAEASALQARLKASGNDSRLLPP